MTRKQKIEKLLPKLRKWLAIMQQWNAAEEKIIDAFGIVHRPALFEAGYDAIDLFAEEISGTPDGRYGNWCNYFFYDCAQGKTENKITINGKPRPLKTLEDLAGIIIDTRKS